MTEEEMVALDAFGSALQRLIEKHYPDARGEEHRRALWLDIMDSAELNGIRRAAKAAPLPYPDGGKG